MFAIAGGILIAATVVGGLVALVAGLLKVSDGDVFNEGKPLMGCGGTLLGLVLLAWVVWG